MHRAWVTVYFPSTIVSSPGAVTPTGLPPCVRGCMGLPGGLNNRPACLWVCTAQNCEERNLKESGYQCEWRYNSCAPACPVTCQHPEPLACPVQCVEGCHAHCPPGEALGPVWGWHGGWGWSSGKCHPVLLHLSLTQGPFCPQPRHPTACFYILPPEPGQLRFLPS